MCGSWRNFPPVPWVSGGRLCGGGRSSSHLLCVLIVLSELCTLALLHCAAFIQIFLTSSQENSNSYVFGEGTPCLWSHNMTNITAPLCLASGFISLVTIPDLLLRHCYSWDTLYSRTDSYKLRVNFSSTRDLPPSGRVARGGK